MIIGHVILMVDDVILTCYSMAVVAQDSTSIYDVMPKPCFAVLFTVVLLLALQLMILLLNRRAFSTLFQARNYSTVHYVFNFALSSVIVTALYLILLVLCISRVISFGKYSNSSLVIFFNIIPRLFSLHFPLYL